MFDNVWIDMAIYARVGRVVATNGQRRVKTRDVLPYIGGVVYHEPENRHRQRLQAQGL